MTKKIFFFFSLLAFTFAGCSSGHVYEDGKEKGSHSQNDEHIEELIETVGKTQDEKVQIIASFSPLAHFAQKIVGDLGEVNNIGAGKDPHEFQITPQNIIAMEKSDLILLQGSGMESWGEDIEHQMTEKGKNVLVVTEHLKLKKNEESYGEHTEENNPCKNGVMTFMASNYGEIEVTDVECQETCSKNPEKEICTTSCLGMCVPQEIHDEHEKEYHEEYKEDDHDEEYEDEDDHGHDDEHDHGEYDPHTWLDPLLAIQTAREISEALQKIDPKNTEEYKKNFKNFSEELKKLDQDFAKGFEKCERKEVVVSHDAFSYLSARYAFETHPISGLSTYSEPSAKKLAEIKELVEKEGHTHIFVEKNASGIFSETLARETGVETLVLNPLPIFSAEENYTDLMRENLKNLKVGMGCR